MMGRARHSRRLRIRALAVATLAALSLTACQAIPSSGPVNVGLTDLSQADPPLVYNARGPLAGSTQEEIVGGFVQAASSHIDDYAIAREFLAPKYAEQWDPSTGVLIDDGTRPYRAVDDNAGVLAISAIASVDEHGVLAPAQPGPTTEMRFEFERVEGEWRIASAPTGIILDRNVFTTVWDSHQLAFLGADRNLLQETRWFPNRASLTTQIVSELLAGPSEGLQGAARSGFPAGTSLLGGSVPAVDGVARIDLSGEITTASESVLTDVNRQLSASLRSVPLVTEYEILAEGTLLDSGSVGGIDEPEERAIPQETFALQDGVFGIYESGEELEQLPGIGRGIATLAPEAVTVDRGLTGAAVLGEGGISWVGSDGEIPIDDRGAQIQPSVDPFGYVWTYSRAEPGMFRVTKPGEEPFMVEVPWLATTPPAAARISPDGSRIAALIAEGDGSAVIVSAIAREDSGRPVSTSENARTQLWVSSPPIDLDWVDGNRFAALTRVGAAAKVTISGPGIFEIESGSVPGGTSISGGGIRSMLRVLGAEGDVYAPQGRAWQRQDGQAEMLGKIG